MDPISIALLGSTALQGFSTLLGGFASAQQNAAQAQQARIDARNAGIASTEAAEQSQYQLRRQLGTINTLQATRGVSTISPTSQAVDDQTIAMSNRNEGIQRFGDLQQQQAYNTQARGYTTAEEWAIPLGVMGGGAQVLGGVSKAFPSWGVPTAGGGSLADMAGFY